MTDNTIATFDLLISAKRRFPLSEMKHYRGTWDAILRTPGVQGNNALLARAMANRNEVVQYLAYENWSQRGRPDGDSWFDWFRAEGLLT
jgi:hypothetical protein